MMKATNIEMLLYWLAHTHDAFDNALDTAFIIKNVKKVNLKIGQKISKHFATYVKVAITDMEQNGILAYVDDAKEKVRVTCKGNRKLREAKEQCDSLTRLYHRSGKSRGIVRIARFLKKHIIKTPRQLVNKYRYILQSTEHNRREYIEKRTKNSIEEQSVNASSEIEFGTESVHTVMSDTSNIDLQSTMDDRAIGTLHLTVPSLCFTPTSSNSNDGSSTFSVTPPPCLSPSISTMDADVTLVDPTLEKSSSIRCEAVDTLIDSQEKLRQAIDKLAELERCLACLKSSAMRQ